MFYSSLISKDWIMQMVRLSYYLNSGSCRKFPCRKSDIGGGRTTAHSYESSFISSSRQYFDVNIKYKIYNILRYDVLCAYFILVGTSMWYSLNGEVTEEVTSNAQKWPL